MTAETQDSLDDKFNKIRQSFQHTGGFTIKERKKTLKKLKRSIISREGEIIAAIKKDFGSRATYEILSAEIYVVVENIKYTIRNIDEWAEKQNPETELLYWPAKIELRYQPLGVIGIISPWNYPFQLALLPIIAAISAGNYFMVKPSEFVPNTSKIIKDILFELLPEKSAVIEGGKSIGASFSKLSFDHIFFTGSPKVGKLVMKSAAENLTPVTLELGGKSPAIIHGTYSLSRAVSRITFGKYLNSGQTCIAPDYILCHKDQLDQVVQAFIKTITKSFPNLSENENYTNIINEQRLETLKLLISDAKEKGAEITVVNPGNGELKGKMAPHIITKLTEEMLVMKEELFGPILPIIPYNNLDDAIKFVNDRPRPLALYYFDNNKKRIEKVLTDTCSGGVGINDTILQVTQANLPFGGVGESGMGKYHAKCGFETFSHKKSVFKQSRIAISPIVTKAPYPKWFLSLFRFLIRI
jgi:coniferyl-aldehyde dehydrogenase